MTPPTPRSTLFPYTTLFRSRVCLSLAGELNTAQATQRAPISLITKDQVGIRQIDVIEEIRKDGLELHAEPFGNDDVLLQAEVDRKSTRLNSSHANISYAVFC